MNNITNLSTYKDIKRLERKVKALEQALRQQSAITKKYNEALAALEKKDRFLHTVIESNRNAIIAVDKDYNVIVYNRSAEEMFGYSKKEILYQNPFSKIVPEDLQEKGVEAVHRLIEKSRRTVITKRHYRFRLKRKDGTLFPVRIGLGITYDNEEIMIVANIEDLSDHEEIRRKKEELEHKAHHDPLTDIPNRLMFQNRLRELLEEKNFFSLFYIDLNNFKYINDVLGHDYGDKVLITVAKRMNEVIGERGMVARLGGDEFVILVPKLTEQKEIKRLVSKLIKAIETKINISHHDLLISASIGIASFPKDGQSENELIKKADQAMYNAKFDSKYRTARNLKDQLNH